MFRYSKITGTKKKGDTVQSLTRKYVGKYMYPSVYMYVYKYIKIQFLYYCMYDKKNTLRIKLNRENERGGEGD